jgi:hypothetical protein
LPGYSPHAVVAIGHKVDDRAVAVGQRGGNNPAAGANAKPVLASFFSTVIVKEWFVPRRVRPPR